MNPVRHGPDDAQLADIFALVHRCFAYMDGRIDPPSSLHRMTVADIARQCREGEVWSLGAPLVACVLLTPRPDCLYLGKLAVDPGWRGRGLARQLVSLATDRARALGLPRLELETRIELVENHAAFRRLGFVKTATSTHPGFDRPTSVIMQKPL